MKITTVATVLAALLLLTAACGGSAPVAATADPPDSTAPPVRPVGTEATITAVGDGPPTGPRLRIPPADVTWRIQYEGEIEPSTDVGLFDLDLVETPDPVMRGLSSGGVYLLCYFSAGSLEDWRPDAGSFPAEVVGEPLDGWPGERWLDIRRIDILGPIMEARLDLAVERGCDGVDPDNVNGFEARSGFDLSPADQIRYNTWLAESAHARGLAVALKNDLNQVAELEPFFDLAVNEECIELGECELEAPFVEAAKAVLGVEYSGDPEVVCARSAELGHRTLMKHLELDSWTVPC